MMPRRWTEEAIDNVLTRIRAGEKTADIAAEFGISRVSLRSAHHKHPGAGVSKAREEMYGDMSKLWQDGVKIADIASRRTASVHHKTRMLLGNLRAAHTETAQTGILNELAGEIASGTLEGAAGARHFQGLFLSTALS